ncbi:Fic family protein [Flavobacterium sp.]|uniref:Fic family protein n=1 Tax=Flavobacterium sp. TaxID=239 RepID=UPI000ECE64B4|nr:Fic family protein [Flavobacterium sp.]HCQ12291.1 hypothetical protein [Flavobacterium sp.]
MSYIDSKNSIDAIKSKVKDFGELTIDQKKKINYKFRLEWNFNSNSMEGNTLTIEETRSVMVGNLTVNDKPLKDILEMQGHDKVITEILRIGKGELRLSEKRICEIHKAIMHEDDKAKIDKIGKWKQEPNMIYNHKGERYDFVAPEEVPERIHKLLDKTNAAIDAILGGKKNAPHPIDVAMDFHLEYLDIHPFYDGNGRTARILTNLILISLGYNPFWINEKDRKIYYNYISDIQGYGGDKEVFFDYCAGLILRSEQIVLDAIQDIDITDEEDLTKEISLWKKQLIKKDEVVPSSNELIAELYKKYFKKLFEKFLVQTNVFDELFAKKVITNYINNQNPKVNKLEYFDEKMHYINIYSKLTSDERADQQLKPLEGISSISLGLYYSGFKNDGLNTFDAYSNIHIEFNQYYYFINDTGNNRQDEYFLKKLYTETITDKEINDIVKTAVSKMFEQIKASVKNQ